MAWSCSELFPPRWSIAIQWIVHKRQKPEGEVWVSYIHNRTHHKKGFDLQKVGPTLSAARLNIFSLSLSGCLTSYLHLIWVFFLFSWNVPYNWSSIWTTRFSMTSLFLLVMLVVCEYFFIFVFTWMITIFCLCTCCDLIMQVACFEVCLQMSYLTTLLASASHVTWQTTLLHHGLHHHHSHPCPFVRLVCKITKKKKKENLFCYYFPVYKVSTL